MNKDHLPGQHKSKSSRAAALALFLGLTVTAGGVAAGTLPARAEAAQTQSQLTANGISTTAPVSITISITKDDWYVPGAIFRLYKVASLNDNLEFEPTAKFRDVVTAPGESYRIKGASAAANGKIDIQPYQPLTENTAARTAGEWEKISADLIKAVRDRKIPEDATAAMTDRKCAFTQMAETNGTGSLGLGLYLIQGDTVKDGDRTVTYQPVLICVPQNYNTTNGTRDQNGWQYQVTSYVKSADATKTPPDSPPGDDHPHDHPHHHDNPGGDTTPPPSTESTTETTEVTTETTEVTTETTEVTTETTEEEHHGHEGGGGSNSSSGSGSSEEDDGNGVRGANRGRNRGGGEDGGDGSGVKGSNRGRNSRTGDDSNLPVYFGLMGIAAVILGIYAAVVIYFRRRRDK